MSEQNVSTGNLGSGIGIGIGVLIAIFVLFVCSIIWGTCTDGGKSTFANIKSKLSKEPSLKELDILVFIRPQCPWCIKTLELLKNENQLGNVTIVDTTTPQGLEISKNFGADQQAVPAFISRKNKVGTVGYRQSIKELVKSLQPPTGVQTIQSVVNSDGGGGGGGDSDISTLKIVMFARQGCGYCTKAKESIANAGVGHAIQVVDTSTPEGSQLMASLLPPGTNGVPAWYSHKTLKHAVGYKPIEEIIKQLS